MRAGLHSIYALVLLASGLAGLVGGLLARASSSGWMGPMGALAGVGIGALLLLPALRRGKRTMDQIQGGLDRLSRGEALSPARAAQEGSLVQRLDAVGALLSERQRSAEQSEQLLHTLIDEAPMAILLLEDLGTIEYANETARTLFFEGRAQTNANFLTMLAEAPAPLREAVLGHQDRLFTVTADGSPETYALAKRNFDLHGRTHTLLMVKHLTRELRQQEIDTWKKLIRVLSHELNNSLAPITSMVHSARIMTQSGQSAKLERVFSTIEERAHHLQAFVESYARFARLPKPRREPVNLREFASHIEALSPKARVVQPPEGVMAHFDRSQMEQVIINLLKNAQEAGGAADEVVLSMDACQDTVVMEVVDRGPGMNPEVLQNAMVPFYSTKENGTGLGLALCREIVEAHGGTIALANREGGGLAVTCSLPGPDRPASPPLRARLTLSRV